jgi:Mn2+/Fe2+ NRAMP family transporter
VNGVAAAPIMAMMMIFSMRKDIMGDFTLPPLLQAIGWLATAVMAMTIVAMVVTPFM